MRFWLLPLLLCGSAWAERSPGPLSTAHAALDGGDQCKSCHTDGKSLANDRCLGCHDHAPLKRRIDEGGGFHASERAAGKPCYLCHTEHKGRSKDISGFPAVGGRDRFDHRLAGWPLTGAHARLGCAKCHEGRSFLDAKPACASCHGERNPHGELRASLRACERCHGTSSFAPLPTMSFDHEAASDARFALSGKHEGLACARCHEGGRYRAAGPAPDCAPCHKNPHSEPIYARTRCGSCHPPSLPWAQTRFDHGKLARFALDGQHGKIACDACHKPGAKQKLARACEGCHTDVHAGRFSRKTSCGACHTAKSWTESFRFDHQRATTFPLLAKHAQIPCRACHRGDSPTEFEQLSIGVTPAPKGGAKGEAKGPVVACMSCHRHATVHKGQFKNAECLRCHVSGGSKEFKNQAKKGFHGPGSRWPLTEAHALVNCEGCHKGGIYSGTPTDCGPACHADRLHKGSLGGECTRCHEGGHWAASAFDHDDSTYPLTGHHADVACAACHRERVYQPTPRACATCHLRDDAHAGSLGTACEDCHSPSGRSLFDHNDPKAPARFRLDGKHGEVACKACHPGTAFATAPRACEGCHAEPQSHPGNFGGRCGACHDVSGWKSLHAEHETPRFRFGGAHDRQPCGACHEGRTTLRGTAELCIACHRRDDIHHNALGPRCGECHGQESWSGPQVRFFHERVGCDLRGLHRTLPCLDCHVGGNFVALAPTCVACHRGDAIRAARTNPKAGAAHAGFLQCAPCHNVNYFAPSRASGSESVCR